MNTRCAKCWKPSAASQRYLGSEIFQPAQHTEKRTTVVCFDSNEHLNACVQSDVHKTFVERVKELVQKVDMHEIMVGIDFSFIPEIRRLKPWKQFLITLSAVYPIKRGRNRRLFGSFIWASIANAAPNAFGAQLAYPGRQTIALCGDGGFTMLALGDLLTQVERKTPVVQIILNNESLDFVNIEQEEGGIIPFGVDSKNPNLARVAEAIGAKGIRIEEPGDVRRDLLKPRVQGRTSRRGCCRGSACARAPVARSVPTMKGYTLSVAKQVLSGRMQAVIKTIERNVGLV